jgi:hypothetical protein
MHYSVEQMLSLASLLFWRRWPLVPCARCGDMVRDKPILGTHHSCDADGPTEAGWPSPGEWREATPPPVIAPK